MTYLVGETVWFYSKQHSTKPLFGLLTKINQYSHDQASGRPYSYTIEFDFNGVKKIITLYEVFKTKSDCYDWIKANVT